MKSTSTPSLFSNLSPEAASQTKGGHWSHTHCYYSYSYPTTVRVRYYPSSGSGGHTVNINNSDIDDDAVIYVGS
ncbi:MAG: hypothetical protein AAF572_20545 [Cyanobacteria bacterium P01_B01_bin.77]